MEKLRDMNFVPYDSVENLLADIKASRPLWYQAPMDYKPARVKVALVKGKTTTVRMRGPCGVYTIEVLEHLDRFRRGDKGNL